MRVGRRLVKATAGDYAGFWLRFSAVAIDGELWGIVYLTLIVFGAVVPAMSGNGDAFYGPFAVAMFVAFFAHWVYFASMESSKAQATLGKQAMGIVVTDVNWGGAGLLWHSE